MGEEQKLKIPQADQFGFVATLNQMGYMTSRLDPFSQAFVDFSPHAGAPVLEIGAAYGVASLEALKKGAKVIANDVDPRHLEILKECTPDDLKSQLVLASGKFPDEITIEPESVGAVLVCRVFHFFDGETVQRAGEALFRWLRPGGKVFIVADTPYLRTFQTFIPTYLQRKASQVPWPGMIDNLHELAPQRASQLPKYFHCMDPEVLTEVFSKAGFQVERAELFSQSQYPEDIRLDGREGVGLVAVKTY